MPRNSDHRLIKYHLKSRTRAKKDRANKAKGEKKGRIAWEMQFVDRNTAIKMRRSVLRIAVNSYLTKKYCDVFVVHILKNKIKSPFRDLHCKTKELILLQ